MNSFIPPDEERSVHLLCGRGQATWFKKSSFPVWVTYLTLVRPGAELSFCVALCLCSSQSSGNAYLTPIRPEVKAGTTYQTNKVHYAWRRAFPTQRFPDKRCCQDEDTWFTPTAFLSGLPIRDKERKRASECLHVPKIQLEFLYGLKQSQVVCLTCTVCRRAAASENSSGKLTIPWRFLTHFFEVNSPRRDWRSVTNNVTHPAAS